MEQELTVQDYAYSIRIGSLIGFLIGWAIGLALILYLDSQAFYQWGGLVSIPLSQGFGWALFGVIAGSGGIFAHLGRKPVAELNELRHAAKAA
jgi:hypothetical protein